MFQNSRRGAADVAPGASHVLRPNACSGLAIACALLLGAGGAVLPILDTPPALAKGPDSLADLAAEVSDTVVNISATQTIDEKHASNSPQLEPARPSTICLKEFFRRRQQGGQGGNEAPPPRPHERKSNSLGSGFVIDPSGHHCDQ